MSDARALAAVGATLRRLLQQRLTDPVPVTLASPAAPPGDVPGRRLNLFLYQVTHNASLRNQAPERLDPRGTPARPPLALDLTYLVTAYGNSDEDQLDAHEVLGDAMSVFHDHAIIDPRDEAAAPLIDADLRAAAPLRIVPDTLGLDDSSAVWHALSTPYRLSATYRVSVVLIHSRGPYRHIPLVREPPRGPIIHATDRRPPRLERLRVQRADDPHGLPRNTAHARPSDTLWLQGHHLDHPDLTLCIDDTPLAAEHWDLQADHLLVHLPDAPHPGPGPHTLHARAPLGGHDIPSNRFPFLLVPRIDKIEVQDGTLRLTGALLDDPSQARVLLIDQTLLEDHAASDATPTHLTVRLPDELAPGRHALRLLVGGCETLAPTEFTL